MRKEKITVIIWVPPEVNKDWRQVVWGLILGKWGSYQVSYYCEHLELSPSGNSGRQFRTVGQWADIFIYHLLPLIEWVMLLGTLAFVHFWPALHKAKGMLPNWKKAIRQRVTDFYSKTSLQSVQMKLEGRWLCSDSVSYMPYLFY